jgi:hypothetical protein
MGMGVFGFLRKRLSHNEGLKAGQGEICPRCGEHPMMLFHHGRVPGPAARQERHDVWACANAECKYYEHRVVRL